MVLSGLSDILKFLDFLRSKKIGFALSQDHLDSIMVAFTLVGCRVEVDFFRITSSSAISPATRASTTTGS